MAIDPTQSIQTEQYESALATRVRGELARLASLPPSLEVPYLTVTLDWRPAGESPAREDPDDVRRSEERGDQEESVSRRPSRLQFEQAINDLRAEHGPRGPIFDSIDADGEHIRQYIASELDPAAQGVVIIACSAMDVFEAVPLAVPVPTEVTFSPVPKLLTVARVISDNPTYAVLLADQKDAVLSMIRYGQRSRSLSVEGTGYPRHQQQGGWSQRRYQMRADERVEAFARDVAEEVRTLMDRLDIKMLIVAGDEVITPVLDDAFHQTVKDRIIARIPMDIRATEQDILDATLPIVEEAQRNREAEIVQQLSDAVGAGEKGAAGGEATLEALQIGQVQTLVVADTYDEEGWEDFSLPVAGVGHVPKEHPAGGDVSAMVPIEIEESFIRMALQQDAEIVFIHSAVPVSDEEQEHIPDAGESIPITEAASRLNELGGVGAIFRYELGQAPPETI